MTPPHRIDGPSRDTNNARDAREPGPLRPPGETAPPGPDVLQRVPPVPRLATWLLRLLLSQHFEDGLLGDLIEEHALIAAVSTRSKASAWYWKQTLGSITPLLWAESRRGRWLKTLGAVVLGYAVVTLIVVASDFAMARFAATLGDQIYAIISLASGFAAMLLGGYLAAWMRPRAAAALAMLAALMGIVSLAVTGDRAPVWYQIALVIIGPAAAITGGRLKKRQKQ